jgi:hypothetical protein
MLAGPVNGRAGRWLDVRWPQPSNVTGMGRDFLPADRLDQAGPLIEGIARRIDVYIGVALHDRRAGDGSSVSRSHLAWADVDREDAQSLLDAFPHAPTMTVASGSPGRRHAYWLLRDITPIDDVMTANRKLAGAFARRDPGTGEWLRNPKSGALIGGDLSAGVSRVAMLRPTGTYNYKRGERRPVQIVDLAGSRVYDLSVLVDGLEDPKPPKPPFVPSDLPPLGLRLENPSIDSADKALRAIDAREWMPRLTGIELTAAGYMPCPFHDEETASLKAYPNGSWYCYGCNIGGSIIDFACLLNNRPTRGDDFIEVRADLARQFFGVDLPTPASLRARPVHA